MKPALIVSQYMNTYWHHFPTQGYAVTGCYTARTQVKAPKMKPNHIKQLQAEVAALCASEKALVSILSLYPVPNANRDKIMVARTNLLAAFGKMAIRIGAALDAEETKLTAMGLELLAPEREKAVAAIVKSAHSDAETKYRAALVEALVYEPAELPSALFPGKEKAEKEVKENRMEAAVAEEGADIDGDADKWEQIGTASLKNTK